MSPEQYAKELGECLKKYSVDELIAFVDAHRAVLGDSFVDAFDGLDETGKQLMLWDMILKRTDMPEELQKRAFEDYWEWRSDQRAKYGMEA